MNIKRAKEEIKNSIEAYLLRDEQGEYVIPVIRQRPILLLGAPGIGKTQIMEQIARECQIGLVAYTITHHTRQSAIGLPFVSKKEYQGKEYTVTEYTMSEIVASVYDKMEKTGKKEGILFIDEVNCVSETLAPAMLQFLQCKTFGNQAIPQGWIIVAAGNPPEYNKSVRDFDVVTMDRVKKIQVEPDYQVWREYAIQEQIHPGILSYLELKPQNFYKMETTVDGRSFATPRGWEDLSRLIEVYEQLGKSVDAEVVVQYIQYEKIAREFASYLELYGKYQMDYQMEQVFAGVIPESLKKKASHASFDERVSVVHLVLNRCNQQFRILAQEEQLLEKEYPWLKKAKKRLAENQQGYYACMQQLMKEFEQRWQQEKEAELLSRSQNQLMYQVHERLLQYVQLMDGQEELDQNQAIGLVMDQFEQEQDDLDLMHRQAEQMLEYAFDFMEQVFPAASGQEMVLFVTGLNSSPYAVEFLETYDCARYDQYNHNLLFSEKREEIRRQLEQLK